MQAMCSAAFFIFQDAGTDRHDTHWGMIWLFVIALALVAQAVGLIITAMIAGRLLLRFNSIGDVIEKKIGPILDQTQRIVAELTPKIEALSENAQQISYTIRDKVDELGATVTQLNQTVQEINGRTRIQVSRVDGIVTNALVATEEISASVQQSIRTPVKQIAGLVAGVKAGIETLIERSPFGRG